MKPRKAVTRYYPRFLTRVGWCNAAAGIILVALLIIVTRIFLSGPDHDFPAVSSVVVVENAESPGASVAPVTPILDEIVTSQVGDGSVKQEQSLANVLAELHARVHADETDVESVARLSQALFELVKRDPARLQDLLYAFSANNSIAFRAALADTISNFPGPAVDAFAVGALADGRDRELTVAALNLLQQAHPSNVETIIFLADRIAMENDTEILAGIVDSSLPTVSVDETTRAAVLANLEWALSNSDPSLRESVAFAIARWARTEQELDFLIRDATSQTASARDRSTALLALQEAAAAPEGLKKAVFDSLRADTSDVWATKRKIAILGRYQLTSEESSELASIMFD